LPDFNAPSTFFQLTRPLSVAWSWTRSALREFVTTTVTVDAPSDAFGLSFVAMPAASAETAIEPQSAVASAKARIHLVMIVLRQSCATLRWRRWRESGKEKARISAALAAP
jgi:mannose/cellobiose epimerase-like protein (N-acyl-D-glucosamine 2-epimerase family)